MKRYNTKQYEYAIMELKSSLEYGVGDYIDVQSLEIAVKTLENQIPKPICENNVCPCCDSYNDTIKKRKNTVNGDICYCWHCGQALKFQGGKQ